MVRIFRIYYPSRVALLVATEACLISLSFIFAAYLLFQSDSFLLLRYDQGLLKIAALTIACVLGLHYCDLYNLREIGPVSVANFRLLLVLGLFAISVAVVEKLFPGISLAPGVIFVGTVLLVINLFTWRLIFSRVCRTEALREDVLLVGDANRCQELASLIGGRGDLGWRPVCYDPSGANGIGVEDILSCVRRLRAHRVIVAFNERRGRLPINDLARVRMAGVQVEDAATVIEKLLGRMDLRFTRPSVLAFSSGAEGRALSTVLRRLCSILLSLTLLTIALPAIALIAILIRVDSPGPIVIRQPRIGKNGRVFYARKFRSMVKGSEHNGFRPAQANDARITRVGRVLRRWHLDELPQLLNILRGDMSFVGPRPFVPEWETQLEQDIPLYGLRHLVKPGLTGWAQINYGYCETLEDNRRKLELDLYYIKNVSVLFDLWIVFETTKLVLFGRPSPEPAQQTNWA